MNTSTIKSAKYLKDYIISFKLSNGKSIQVDFYKFIRGSDGIHYKEFLDIKKFKKFSVDSFGIYWEGNTMDFHIDSFYKGELVAMSDDKKMSYAKKYMAKKEWKDYVKWVKDRDSLVIKCRGLYNCKEGLLDLSILK